MTSAEVFEKFGDPPLRFSSYYKYTFTFKGERDGFQVTACIGGASEEIYRLSVKAEVTRTLSAPEDWYLVTVTDAAGEEVFSHYDPY